MGNARRDFLATSLATLAVLAHDAAAQAPTLNTPAGRKIEEAHKLLETAAQVSSDRRVVVAQLIRGQTLAREGMVLAARNNEGQVMALGANEFALSSYLLLLAEDDFTGAEQAYTVLSSIIADRLAEDPNYRTFNDKIFLMAGYIGYRLGQRNLEGADLSKIREALGYLERCSPAAQAIRTWRLTCADCAILLGDWRKAQLHADAALGIRAHPAFVDPSGRTQYTPLDTQVTLETLAVIAAKQGNWAKAWTCFERARAGSLEAIDQPVDTAALERIWGATDAVVAMVCADSCTQLWVATRTQGLLRTTLIDGFHAGRLQRESFLYGGFLKPAVLKDEFRAFWSAFAHAHGDGGDVQELQKWLTDFGRPLGALFGLALEGVWATLRQARVKRVLWLPQANFAIVPMAAARRGSIRAPAQDFVFKQAHGLRDCLPLRPATARFSALTIAPDNQDIPMARAEAGVVNRLLPRVQPSPIIVHAATHAGLTPEGLRIKTADDALLNTAQFADAYMRGRDVRLVTLSACESGYDIPFDSNTIFAFPPRDLMKRGAAGVIASLWEVDDAATFFIMSRCYWLIAAGGRPDDSFSAARAWLISATKSELQAFIGQLRDAGAISAETVGLVDDLLQKSVGDPPFAHPRYWGAWIYFGQ